VNKMWQKLRMKKASQFTKLPSFIKKVNTTYANGPNCWNATIKFFHDDVELQYISEDIMKGWLNTYTIKDKYKLCKPNTIMAMYKGSELLHTAVYVAPGLLWHKYGYAGYWEFITEKELIRAYPEHTKLEYRLYNAGNKR
jgi:hypothetical protein